MKKFTVNFRQKSNPFSCITRTKTVRAETWEKALDIAHTGKDTWFNVLDAKGNVITTLEQIRYGGETNPFTSMPVKKGVAHIQGVTK